MTSNPGKAPAGMDADENFEEDDDELDIFAESNKNEPMRNPIIGSKTYENNND